MANNIKLTPELEAAFKKANMNDEDIRKIMEGADVQKMGLDDLDGFSGGAKEAPDDFRVCGMTQLEAGSLLQAIVDYFGIDIAIDFATDNWVRTRDWATYLRASEGCNEGYYAVFMIWGKIYVGGF